LINQTKLIKVKTAGRLIPLGQT